MRDFEIVKRLEKIKKEEKIIPAIDNLITDIQSDIDEYIENLHEEFRKYYWGE